MAQLRQDYHQFEELDTAVLVVGPENAEQFENYWKINNLPFVGLPDPEQHVLKLYGQEIKLFKWGRLPAQVIIDRHGIARYVHYGKSMSDISENSKIMEILGALKLEHKSSLR